MTELSIVVAMDDNRLIGKNNELPWHMPADLAFFKRTTMGKPIVMGRKTFESIGRPLPGRRNVVVTRDREYRAPGCEVANGIDDAMALCADSEEVMLIGGAELYRQTLHRATRLYVTLIHQSFDGNAWFPRLDSTLWRPESRENFDADYSNPYPYSFIKYVREV
ncbi:MAG: dihydrofolate reductase [Gammaproteobacteria bacterium]|nr:dihydrofolate reductase [Gammaproteobacteria bacterium]